MALNYILLENGVDRILLENSSGRVILESSNLPYGTSSGTEPGAIYESNSGVGGVLYLLTTGTNPDEPYEEN